MITDILCGILSIRAAEKDDYDDEAYWDEMTICPYNVDSDLCYLKNYYIIYIES